MFKRVFTILCCLFLGGVLHAAEEKQAGERMTLTINDVEYAFRWCPPGKFIMGSPKGEKGRWDIAEEQREVTLTKDFWMLETEVTQEMWESVMDENPSKFQDSKKLPVEQVSWEDCQKYIEKLNALGVAPEGYTFSLPTNAQWEYACRAGTTTTFHFGKTLNGDQANCDGPWRYKSKMKEKYPKNTTEVGSYPANAWGLYDMHGNVCELCLDQPYGYTNEAVTDPMGVSRDPQRMVRGGSYDRAAVNSRSAYQEVRTQTDRDSNTGLRLAIIPKN